MKWFSVCRVDSFPAMFFFALVQLSGCADFSCRCTLIFFPQICADFFPADFRRFNPADIRRFNPADIRRFNFPQMFVDFFLGISHHSLLTAHYFLFPQIYADLISRRCSQISFLESLTTHYSPLTAHYFLFPQIYADLIPQIFTDFFLFKQPSTSSTSEACERIN